MKIMSNQAITSYLAAVRQRAVARMQYSEAIETITLTLQRLTEFQKSLLAANPRQLFMPSNNLAGGVVDRQKWLSADGILQIKENLGKWQNEVENCWEAIGQSERVGLASPENC